MTWKRRKQPPAGVYQGHRKREPGAPLVLGCCATLAVTTAASNAIGMGPPPPLCWCAPTQPSPCCGRSSPTRSASPPSSPSSRASSPWCRCSSSLLSRPGRGPGCVPAPDCSQLHHPGPCGDVRQQEQGPALHCGRPGHGGGLYRHPAVHGHHPGAFRGRNRVRPAHPLQLHGAHHHLPAASRRVLRIRHAGGSGGQAVGGGQGPGNPRLRPLSPGRLLYQAGGKSGSRKEGA